MKLRSAFTAAVAALLGTTAAADVAENESPFSAIVALVNSNANATWVAEAPEHRFGSFKDVEMTLGTWLPGHANYSPDGLPDAREILGDDALDAIDVEDLPTDFDSRTHWKDCTVISKVRDQSACGSCWAFGSTEAFEDRRCVATGEDVEYSSDDTAGCCKGLFCGMSMGCNGGQPGSALRWMCRTGVVTGGDYPDREEAEGGCKPYEFPPCAHHVAPTKGYPKCKPEGTYEVKCSKSCSDDASGKSYKEDKTKCSRAFSVQSAEDMQKLIYKGGPLAVAFTVFEDFPNYKSGVYKHVEGDMLGGHAVEAVGWGVEDGEPYWWIKNSWNSSWGDGGFFKIARGTNECGIESTVSGVSFKSDLAVEEA